jgi:ribonucleotide monophosphatase NagD (HAD superfamily)
MGVPDDAWDLVVSSGDAAQEAMFAGAVGRRVYHLGPSKDDGFFTDVPEHHRSSPPIERVTLDEAEGIVCTGPFDELTETPEDYRSTYLYAKAKGLKMLCANPDIVVDLGDRRIYCAGALAGAYEEMGGTSLYFGKPHPPVYDLARHRLVALRGHGIEHAGFLAVGDGYDTDIRGAVAEGIDSLFVTGGIFAETFGPDPDAPDPAKLAAWIAGKDVAPTFSIPKLR